MEGLPVLRALGPLPFVEAVGGDQAAPPREGVAERAPRGRGLGAGVDERLVVGRALEAPAEEVAAERPASGASCCTASTGCEGAML